MQVFQNLKVARHLCLAVTLALLLSACATYEYHATTSVPVSKVSEGEAAQVLEATLLDVGITLFNPGVDVLDDVSAAYSNVRESEAVWFTGLLKSALERSNAWGIVRTLPSDDQISDVMITGKIVDSSGEVLVMEVVATDAAGKIWFANEYSERASAYSYNPEVDLNRDPFQSLFNRIANDMFDYRATLASEYLINLRHIAKVRFAQRFAPDSFAGYLEKTEEGLYQLNRIPAPTDPMLLRVEKIQARNELFLDVIQDYYRVFSQRMTSPYDEWRRLSYKEVVYERQLKKKAKQEKMAGVAVIVVGLMATQGNSRTTRIGGHLGILQGADLFRKGFLTQIDASMHAESVRELGESLEAELEPSIIDLQDRSVTLSGTVADQYKEWRRILGEMFEAEQGLQKTSAAVELDALNEGTDSALQSPE